MDPVKPTRRYDARHRREQAQRNRLAILDVAKRRFLADGYAATSVPAIAAEARVSAETVYKAFGGKAGLVRAIYEQGLAGAGAIPAYQRSDELRAHELDPHVLMRRWGALTAEVASTVTPIRLLVRSAAAVEPEMAQLLHESDASRLERMRNHAAFLEERGHLRNGVTPDRAADVMWTCSSAELYELLVMKRGWNLEQFGAFVADLMITTLLPGRDDSLRCP
jgi:AcrR family transcriptional regulator